MADQIPEIETPKGPPTVKSMLDKHDAEKAGELQSESLPVYENEPRKTFLQRVSTFIRPHGQSGRTGFHPKIFFWICFSSNTRISKHINRFWPLVPVAIALVSHQRQNHANDQHWAKPDQQLANFIIPYLAMIPSANLLGFASGQFALKLPHVLGILFETTMGSVVEIVLFIVLIKEGESSIPIIKSAILGSILANLLLCLGACFIAGGLGRTEQKFHEAISEVGSNLMLVAGMGLVTPSIFSASLTTNLHTYEHQVVQISRATAVLLLVAYAVYIYFQTTSHENIYVDIINGEESDNGRARLTLTEALVAVLFSLAMVTFMAVFLVKQIDYLVEERGVKEA
jgi:Ca2+:H+ antiporter